MKLRRTLPHWVCSSALFFTLPLLAAEPPRLWLPLQSLGADWHGQMLQPLADGNVQTTEYANGIKIDLNDFGNTVQNGNGRLFVGLSENTAGFTSLNCQKPDGHGCVGGTLFLGLEVHAQSPMLGDENGFVTVYLDASRQKTLDNQSCFEAGQPTRKPAPDDRKIILAYTASRGQASPTLSVREFKGNCREWVEITPPGLDPAQEAWTVKAAARETLGGNGLPNFLHFELSVTAQPRGWIPLTSAIVNDRLFGLGVRHSINSAVTVGSFGWFPSLFNQPPMDLDTKTWATMDLHEPARIDLAMTAYNVGQLQITDDGGQGEAKDFAKLTFRNDIICLTEEMNESERDETVKAINNLRADEGLDPMKPVYPGNGDPPNNMLLVSGPVIDSDFVLFGDLPEVKTFCAAESDGDPISNGDCTGAGAGYKGVVWARVGVKKSTAAPKGGKLQNWFSDHFIDVFCTHTQADYESDGEFARDQWCLDAIGNPAANVKDCNKGTFGPPENPWQTNVRLEQWRGLKNWAHKKRAGGSGSPNGLDRPAFLLGDFNQIGPKNVSVGKANQDVDNWIAATSAKPGFGTEYSEMRAALGTLPVSAFDQANGWAWDLYDLMARDPRGTWVGEGFESAIPATQANDCITQGQFSGYDTISQLPKEARLDYILVLPAESGFPFYSLTGPSSQPKEPIVDISANPGSWEDGLGCASDHAQVSAQIGLVQTGTSVHYNPNKSHRVTYRVNYLWDLFDSDSGNTDWYVDNNGFEVRQLNAGNALVQSHAQNFPDDVVPDGIVVPVSWHDSFDLFGGDKFRAGVYVKDHDVGPNDLYDTSDFGSGFRGPHFEFEHAYPGTFRLIGNFSDLPGTGRLLGTADASTGDPDGSCVLGCLGIVTVGDGDEPGYDGMVIQSLEIEELP
ncbi:MAG TPA: hypothetical protein VN851_23325 [Thermoanaerobaculia bacterium]|nr:hypothetical protein [Thermoanaerobaculia bacterium]